MTAAVVLFAGCGGSSLGLEAQTATIRLSTAELAALQGFPPDWSWTGTKTANSRMIGNAVPPAIAHAIAAVNTPTTLERAA